MNHVTTVDLTSLAALKVFVRNVREANGTLIISGVRPELNTKLKTLDFDTDIGDENIFKPENEVFTTTSSNALIRARAALNF